MPAVLRSKISISLLSIIVLLIAWEAFGSRGNPLLTSYPSAIFSALQQEISSGELAEAFSQSIGSLSLGYLIAVLIGVPLGLLFGRYRTAEAAGGFYFLGLDAAPLVAFLPLFILWFGLGMAVKVAIVATFSVTPIVINTWAGVRGVPKTMFEVGKAFCASEQFILARIVLPAALPQIMTGLRLGIGRAIVALAVAELFTAINGLGGMLLKRSESYDTAAVFVPAFTFMAIGILMTTLLARLERVVAPWYHATSARSD
jgi:NitT/TauT family transport system permease protein